MLAGFDCADFGCNVASYASNAKTERAHIVNNNANINLVDVFILCS